MKALVTGATGFIGSFLTEVLVRRGHQVAVLRRPETPPRRIEHLLDRVHSILGDFEHLGVPNPNESGLGTPSSAEAILRFSPDTVFHAGWHGVASEYRNDPGQVTRNLESSAELMTLAARSGCRTYVALGSQAEYGPQNRMLNESAPTSPTTTYGVAKLCAFLLSRHLAGQTGMRFAWIRVFSTYGPKDNPDWMIPSLIRSLCRRERPALTAGEQLWDYLYVEDAAEAISDVAETPDASGVFNLGSGRVQTIRRVVEMIRDQIDPSLPLGFGEVPYRPDQVMHLQADVSRLCSVTGWTPRTPLEDGLRRTVESFRHAQ